MSVSSATCSARAAAAVARLACAELPLLGLEAL